MQAGRSRGHWCKASNSPIDREVSDLGQFRGFQKELLFGNEPRKQFDFLFVQVEVPAVQLAIHVGIGKEDFRDAAFEDDIKKVGAAQLVDRLRRQNHGDVVFAPGFERLDDIFLDAGVPSLSLNRVFSGTFRFRKWSVVSMYFRNAPFSKFKH